MRDRKGSGSKGPRMGRKIPGRNGRPLPEPPMDEKFVMTQKALSITMHRVEEAERRAAEVHAKEVQEERSQEPFMKRIVRRWRTVRKPNSQAGTKSEKQMRSLILFL